MQLKPLPLIVILLLFCAIMTGCSSPVAKTEPFSPKIPPGSPSTPGSSRLTSPAPPASRPDHRSSVPLYPSTRELAEGQSSAPLLSPSPLPRTSAASPRSVFLISWDGAGAERVYDLMAQGDLPHFSALARQGLRAESAIPPDPPLTFPVHSSLVTGSLPARTGIVSNAYHDSIDSFYWYRSSEEEPLQAEPLWVTASRAGLTTATVAFPGSSLSRPQQMADYTVDYGVRDAYSRQVKITLETAQGWENLPPSFSPPLHGIYRIPQVARVELLVIDSTDDGAKNYDAVLLVPMGPGRLDGTRQVGEATLSLQEGEWGALVLQPELAAGADFLIQEIDAQQVVLFHTGIYHNSASPRRLLEELNRRFGFFPSGADAYALQHGWISEEDDLWLIERASLWKAEVSAWLYAAYKPDLLFAWQETFDAAGHAFLLEDARQPGYSPERAREYAGYYRRAARVSDLALQRVLEAVDLDATALVLVADHGMTPAHTRVYANTVLEKAGLLKLDARDYVVVEESKALAVASGGALNVYINLKGREESGTVTPEAYPQVQEQIIELLAGLADPGTGEPVFARVLPAEGLAELGLDSPNSGDVFAQANPGYNLDGWRGEEEVFAPLDFYGQHGYDSRLPEMQGIFIAAGAGVPAIEKSIPPVRIVDIAPTIAAMLGFEPSHTVDGWPIPALSGSDE